MFKSVMNIMLSDRPDVYLLLGFILISDLGICGTISVENHRVDDNSTRPEITIPQGTLQGRNMLTRNNRTVYGFVGVPYAQPPTGNLRFAAPLPPDPWNGTLDAGSDSQACPQFNDAGVLSGDENCLHLNVFTPQMPINENSTSLPVMVYIIGGAFRTANNSIARFGPDFLLDKDVVLVVPNFRVGILGFFSTGDEASPGNYGLKDLVRVLEWVQENIEHFGGDPDQVTIFGGSSGAMSVHFLALSNLTYGLFHKMITQSGTAVSGNLNSPRSAYVNRSIKFGEHFGCPTNKSTLLVDCLRGLNVTQLMETNMIFFTWKTYPETVWLPTDEEDGEGAFLNDNPVNLIAAGKIRDIPWLSSVNKDEGLGASMKYYEDRDAFEEFLDQIEIALPAVVGYGGTPDEVAARTAAVMSYYMNDLSANRTLLLDNFTRLFGDATFVYPAYSVFHRQLLLAKSPQYLCSFEYRGTFSHTYVFSGGSTEYSGVAHGDEIIYLFRNHDNRYGPADYEYSEADLRMVDTMVQLWTSFASNGIPTVGDGSTIWEPFSARDNYLRIGNRSDTRLEMEYDFHADRMRFWKELNAGSSSGLRSSLQGLTILLSLCSVFYL